MSIPKGFHTVTPYLTVDGAEAAIELYKKALNAEELSVSRFHGTILNAQLKIGDSVIMLNDEFPDYGAVGPAKRGGTSVTIHLYYETVEEIDRMFQQATDAGFEVTMPLDNAPWGDRYGSFKDPFGHNWSMATHIEEVSDEEFQERMKNNPM